MESKVSNNAEHECIKCGILCDCGGYNEFENDPCCWGCSICGELEPIESDELDK